MTATEVLERVAELLGPNGEHWTQGAYAKVTADGNACWCLAGAVHVVVEKSARYRMAAESAFGFIREAAGDSAVAFNDSHEWPEVKAALHKAIELSGATYRTVRLNINCD